MTILGCGWTATLARVTAVHGPSAPPSAALSCPQTKSLPWTPWKCGLWENPNSQRRCVFHKKKKSPYKVLLYFNFLILLLGGNFSFLFLMLIFVFFPPGSVIFLLFSTILLISTLFMIPPAALC